MDTVVLGGTHQENDFTMNVSEFDRDAIWNGCVKMCPSLKNGTERRDMVGLRPGRNVVRLEKDTITNSET